MKWTLSKIVEQLKFCDYKCAGGAYECEAGLLTRNVAFIALEQLANEYEDGEEQIFALVLSELRRARQLYPAWPEDIVHAAAIANEESGEVVKAVNNFFWGHGEDTTTDICKEAIQAGAMWIRFLAQTPGMYAAIQAIQARRLASGESLRCA